MSETPWAQIKPHYEAGLRTLRDLGEEYGVSHTAIRLHAKEHGWGRNLNAKIQAKAEELVSTNGLELSKDLSNDGLESEIVNANAEKIAGIRESHRKLIEKLRLGVVTLCGQIDEDEPPSKRASVYKTLTEAAKNLIALEREAYGIDKSTLEPDETKPVDMADVARRLAFMLAGADHARVH